MILLLTFRGGLTALAAVDLDAPMLGVMADLKCALPGLLDCEILAVVR